MHFENRSTKTLLRPGATCWRASTARRATLLVDGEEYFGALRAALLQARRQILIAGWDFDTRIRLTRLAESDDAPEELGALLGFLRARHPELEIHVVRWDYHWFYSDDREAETRARLEALGVHFHDDDCHPITGCIHHKVVVIDDALAFCGGIDLTHKRWDTCAHTLDDERRVDPDGKPYIPVHDTQMCVSGPIAHELAEYLRKHWPVGATPPARVAAARSLWPDGLHVDFEDIRVGIARTLAPSEQRHGVREIEAFYLAAIARTERALYIENQYFTSTRIAQAIAERFRKVAQLEGLLVGMDRPKTPSELHTMGYGRSTFCKVLDEAGVHARVPIVAAMSEHVGINVHSKLATFDDRWLTVGSANLNRRSMGFDVECNLILEASTAAHRAQIERLRNRLLAEHLGHREDEIQEALRVYGLAQLPDLPRRARHVVRVDAQLVEPTLGPILAPIFDPEEPWQSTPIQRKHRGAYLWNVTLLLLSLVFVAALAGRYVVDEVSALSSFELLLSSFVHG